MGNNNFDSSDELEGASDRVRRNQSGRPEAKVE